MIINRNKESDTYDRRQYYKPCNSLQKKEMQLLTRIRNEKEFIVRNSNKFANKIVLNEMQK